MVYDNFGNFFQFVVLQCYDILVFGGSECSIFYFFVSCLDQNGIVLNISFDRIFFRLFVDSKIVKNFSVGGFVNYINF